MRRVFRIRNILSALLVLLVLFAIADTAWFAYRLNNLCGPGDHIVRSETDAIETAKVRIFRAHYGSHGKPGYLDEKPALVDFSHTDNCCSVLRTRNIYGVIVWKVSLDGETIGEPKKRKVGVYIELSNCGAVFDDDSFILATPPK